MDQDRSEKRERRTRGRRRGRADPVWVMAFLLSLGFNLAAAYGYAHTIGDGSWEKGLVYPRERGEPIPPVMLTIQGAEKATPPVPPEVKAEITHVRDQSRGGPARPIYGESNRTMSPIVIPRLEERLEMSAALAPTPESLSPIYTQQPLQGDTQPTDGITVEAPPIAVPLPPGYVPWAQNIWEASGNSLATALTADGSLNLAPGAGGSALGAEGTGSGSGGPAGGGNAAPIGGRSESSVVIALPGETEAVPTPPAETAGMERPKGPTRPARVIAQFDPPYPSAARQLGIEGIVLVRVVVTVAGEVGDVSVVESSSHQILDDAAVEAVRKWSFEPALRDGVPTEQGVKVRVKFKIVE